MIFELWQTRIYVGKVRDHDKVKQAFLPFVNDKSNFEDTWTMSHNVQSTMNVPTNDSMPWNVWYDAIGPNLHEFITELKPVEPIKLEVLEAWCNYYEKGGFQEIHEHLYEGRAFSCSYFLEFPENGGNLVFDNQAISLSRACGLPQTFAEEPDSLFVPQVSEGTLVVFPSWVKHFTNPNESDQRRITFSANFRIMPVNYEQR